MSGNPVTWFEIYVKDVQRAKAFYEKTLATRLQELDTVAPGVKSMWTFPMGKDSYGATGALVQMDDGPSGGGAASSCISSVRTALSRRAEFAQTEGPS